MKPKIAGELNEPPTQAEFDLIPLERLSTNLKSSTFYRLHSSDPTTGKPWGPIHFSVRGTTRFDPVGGLGTLYVAQTLGGAMMEIFDDRWGPVGSLGRSVTKTELSAWWVSRINLPTISVFDATGENLSKIGTDAQLLSGRYSVSRNWAACIMYHPTKTAGIIFPSRHNPRSNNLALFKRLALEPVMEDSDLTEHAARTWKRASAHADKIVYGPPVPLSRHPDLRKILTQMEVALLP